MVEQLTRLLNDQLGLMQAAAQVLEESRSRVAAFANRLGSALSVEERETCEAAPELTATVQRVLRYVTMKQY